MEPIACPEEHEFLPLVTGDPLPEAMRKRLEEHLAGCLQCRLQLARLRSEIQGFENLVGRGNGAPGAAPRRPGVAAGKRPAATRYCILCGKEIEFAPTCTNPDCSHAPNFYREVPGPAEVPWGGAGPEVRFPESDPETPTVDLEPATPAPDSPELPPRQTTPLSASPVAMLRRVAPPHAEHLLYPGTAEIGARPPATIIVERPEVSSRHARLDCVAAPGSGWSFRITDNRSRNGTYVNGKRVTSSPVSPGDRIRFASVEYELRVLSSEEVRMTLGME